MGAAVGGGLGAVLAGLAAAGVIALPGIGVLAMGPIAAGGGLLGALSPRNDEDAGAAVSQLNRKSLAPGLPH